MHTSEILYIGDLRTQAVHLHSGHTLETDAPVDNKGKGERFSPTDLVATALGSCMLTIMGIAAHTHNIDIKNTRMHIDKIMIADPMRRIGEIVINIHMPPGIIYTEKQQKILSVAALTCPVYLSLNERTIKSVHFHWEN